MNSPNMCINRNNPTSNTFMLMCLLFTTVRIRWWRKRSAFNTPLLCGMLRARSILPSFSRLVFCPVALRVLSFANVDLLVKLIFGFCSRRPLARFPTQSMSHMQYVFVVCDAAAVRGRIQCCSMIDWCCQKPFADFCTHSKLWPSR